VHQRPKEHAEIDTLAGELESVSARRAELEEEHGGEEGAFGEFEKIAKPASHPDSKRSRATRRQATKRPC